MKDNLRRLKKEILNLRMYPDNFREKPHKPLLLLAVLGLYESGELIENKILFDDKLNTKFCYYFSIIAQDDDLPILSSPYFHLRTSEFWKHKIVMGMEEEYQRTQHVGAGSKKLRSLIEYTYLDNYAYELFSNAESRKELRKFIIDNLFEPKLREKLNRSI